MPVDFKTNQLKVNQIINSGISAGKPLLIYGLGSSTDNSGGFNATHFATGSDTWLFISGTVGSRNSANRGAVAFGGDIIVSGVLYDSSGVAYSAGESYFSSTTTGSIFTTGSAAFVKNEAIDSPLDKGSSVFFYVSGSDAGVGTSLFGGPVISSGSFKTKNSSGDVVATMDNTGLISGSGLQLAIGLTIAGDAAINGGDITSTSTTFNFLNAGVTTVSIAGAANTVNIVETVGGSSAATITINAATTRTGTSTINLATGATSTGNVKAINIGQGGLAGSTTNIKIGTTDTVGSTNLFVSGSTFITGSVSVKGSIVPSANTFDLGSSTNKWGTLHANYITASIRNVDASNPFIVAGSNVTANYNALGQWEITASGGGAGVFTEASSIAAHSTSSIAIGFAAAASTKGSDVFFAVSGSNTAQNTSLFSGPIVTSGSLTVKDVVNGNTLGSISATGVVSGSALQSLGNLSVQGTSALIGNVTVTGDVAVNGGDITTTASTFNIASAASTVNVGSSAGRVVVLGDFEVQGTTTTIDVINITVEDPLMGLGFTTGSISISAGDRGFIGGQPSPSNNIAFGWSQNSGSFIATKTTSAPGATSFVVSDLQPIRAAKFQVSGTTAEIKGNGTSLQLSGTQIDAFASNDGMTFIIDGVTYGQISAAPNLFLGSSAIRYSASTTGFSTAISGADIYLNSDIGRTYFGQAPGGTPNTGLLLTVNPGGAGGAGGSVVFAAKQNETSAPPLPMTMSGSQITFSAADATTGKGFEFQDNGTSIASINKDGSEVKIIASQLNGLTVGGGGSLIVSGTQIILKSGQNGFGFERDGSSFFSIVSGSKGGLSGNVTKLQMGSGKDALVSVDVSNTIFLSGTNTRIGSDTITLGIANFSSAVVNVSASMNVSGSILPSAGGDLAFDLGSPSLRWRNIYTGDLHLRNERGDYTLIEETDFLSIRFNNTGKRYKFLLERVPELDE